jgi:hypothetical protein
MKKQIEKKGNSIFLRLKTKNKLNYISDYSSFTKNKKATQYFIQELEEEKNANNYSIVYLMLTLGFRIGKIYQDLEIYWDYCYVNRFKYDGFRNLLIEFPQMFNKKKNEIYKELGDLEFNKATGHFLDVDTHLREAIKHYKTADLQEDIKKCMIGLQENKSNTGENYPKPIEIIIPVSEADFSQKESYKTATNHITRVTRSSSNNIIYSDLNIQNMLGINIIKDRVTASLFDFFNGNQNISFNEFLDFYSLRECWFFESSIYQMMLPAMFHFYENFKIDINKCKNNESLSGHNYILPLDSLILKFEGIIRLYLENAGVLTIKEGTEKKIEEIINIFGLLAKFEGSLIDKEQKKFATEDKQFFEHIFGSTEMNLRNEIAHSIAKPELYSPLNVIYIIDSIARIGKYSLNPK